MCWDTPAFHLHSTLPSMLSPTLIRDEIIEVRQPCQKRLLAPFRMMEALHGEEFPLEGVMRLIQHRAGYGHVRVGEDRIPARLLVLHPTPDTFPVGDPCAVGHVVNKVAEPLSQRKHAQTFALACSLQQGVALRS